MARRMGINVGVLYEPFAENAMPEEKIKLIKGLKDLRTQ